ncbi:MAG: tetratricopeptide repeat protein [Stellaceae bacterium]
MNRNERRAARKQGGGEAAQPVQAIFGEALRLHQSGRLAEAEQLYRQALARDPRHADSLHLLGVLAYQAGRHADAVELIGQAIRLKDTVAFYHNNLGLALKDQGKRSAAMERFERALALQPDYPEAQINLGNVLMDEGRAEEAAAWYRRALALQPNYPEGQNNLGNALKELGRLEEALACYQRAATLRPNYPEASNNLGNALQQQGRLEDALAAYERALAARPDSPDILNNLGNLLLALGKPGDAVARLERAVALRPDYAEAHNNLGVALDRQGETERAIAAFERALALAPDDAEALNNLGAAQQDRGEIDRAIAAFERALALNPAYAEARKNLGGALHARAGERVRAAAGDLDVTFGGVRGQYEALPFPARDPEGERYLLYVSVPDILGKVNQYCFGGARDFAKGMRVLAAGCGTGDSVIWLAHQLRGTPSEIVALDLSAASLATAKARAEIRGLSGIQWVNASLLDLPRLGLGPFDYITCLGVLHHLAEPEAGLAALAGALAAAGGLALMLYGARGRAHIYEMQEILRRLAAGVTGRAERLALAREVLRALPPTNPFRLREGWDNIQLAYLRDDINLWDTLLHEQDRAYTASQVRSFVASAGLSVQAFASFKGMPATSALQYDLDLYLDTPAARASLAGLPANAREDLAEALDGSLALHTVYATHRADSRLEPSAPEAILSVLSETAGEAIAYLAAGERPLPILLRNSRTLTYAPSPAARAFLAAIDGRRRNDEIASALWAERGASMLADLTPDLRVPAALHWVVARAETGSPVARLRAAGRFALPLRHEEPAILLEPPTLRA